MRGLNTMQTGFTGISFPFRINGKGGVTMSSTSVSDVQHIVEAMEQIILTKPRERRMEYHFKSELDTEIFEPNDSSSRCLIEHQIKEALSSLEDRIEIISVNVYSENNKVCADISFRVLIYNTTYSSKVKVGEELNETGN